jgi:hypothetical protein
MGVGVVGAATAGAGVLPGLSVGPWLGWRIALLVALLAGWRLRFRLSAAARAWRRQVEMQRRSAGVLTALERDGYLVLHDVTLPGWPALKRDPLVRPRPPPSASPLLNRRFGLPPAAQSGHPSAAIRSRPWSGV